MLTRRQRQSEGAALEQAAAEAKKPREARVEDYLAVDPMEIEIGVGLIRLADPKRGGDLLERIQRVRQQVATEIGLIMPKVRIRDNMRLEQNQYRIKIADISVAEGKIFPGMLLAVESGATAGNIGGLATRDPAFDLPATWIERAAREQAEKFGYTLVEPVSVLATHLTEVVRRNADEILNRDATKHLIEELRKTSPTVVDDLIPERMKLVEVQQILQLLLREQVPIRQLAAILETLGEQAGRTRQSVVLVELVRQRLARTISSRYCDKDSRLYVMTLEASLEDRIEENIEVAEGGLSTRLPPHEIEAICSRIEEELDSPVWAQRTPVVLVSPRIRAALKQLTAGRLPRLVVLSYREVTRDAQVESLAQIGDVLAVR